MREEITKAQIRVQISSPDLPGSEDRGKYISGGVSKAQIRVKISSPDLSRSEDGGELHRYERGDFQWTEQDS